jgi:hypothetical protein
MLKFDKAAQAVATAVSWDMDEVLFRTTESRCRRCRMPLDVYYCENRVYAVRCLVCGTVTLTFASCPQDAVRKVGYDENA